MAHFQNQYGATQQSTDEYGNPITAQTDEYGNPIQHGATAGTTKVGLRKDERGMMDKIKEKLPGTGEHRDEPYSSHTTSTTRPYGETGYTGSEQRQEGIMDKIKEKLPGTGGHRDDDPYSSHSHTTSTTTPYGDTTYTGEHKEKKGVMDKIKEKLPGGNH